MTFQTRAIELPPDLAERLAAIVGTTEFEAFELVGVQSLNNRVLQLVCPGSGQAYAVRLASEQAAAHMGVDRREEAAVAQIAGKAGIGPELVHYDLDSGMMISKWIDQAEPLQPQALRQRPIMLQAIALARRLHAIDAGEIAGGRTIFERIAHMERSAAALNAGELIQARHRNRLDALAAAAPRPRWVTHNDLWPNNILAGGTRLWLTDWEFSGIGDGMYDLASLALSAGLDATAEQDLLAAYGDGDLDWLAAMKWVVCYFEAVWSANMALLSASAPAAGGQPFDFKAHSEQMLAKLDTG